MSTFSCLLRRWRQLRELSQLELGERAGVSARHLSFLETGRARPSREMIERLAAALQLAEPVRRELLAAGGFAASWLAGPEGAAIDAELARALALVLQRHDPYPALLLERTGTVRQANAGAVRLLELFADEPLPEPWTVHALLHALRASFEDWEGVQSYVAAFFAEAPASSLPPAVSSSPAASSLAVFRFTLRRGQRRAHLATLATQLAVASTAAEAGLRLELFQPLDDVTEALLRSSVEPAAPAGRAHS